MKRLLQAYRFSDSLDAMRGLRHWYGSPLGRRVYRTEQEILDQVLPNLFGFHLLQVGRPVDEDLLRASRIGHRFILEGAVPRIRRNDRIEEGLFVGEFDAQPVADDCIDVLLLPHTLEFASQPHELLREAERVLIPEGHVVILGFNPWSLFGVRRLLTGWRDTSPWCGHFYSTLRLKDWLALLGFDTVLIKHYFFRPPFHHDAIMQRLAAMERWGERFWPPLGGGYLMVAKKRVATLTPIKPRWRSSRRLISVSPAEPTARQDGT